jgi:hypothetical protein
VSSKKGRMWGRKGGNAKGLRMGKGKLAVIGREIKKRANK